MLLERQNELKTAAEALRLAAQGSGSLVVVSGPPGIGKSALLTEIGELATRSATGQAPRRPLVMRAYAAAAERDFPLGVTRQLLEPVLHSGAFATRWCSGAARPALAFLQDDPDSPRQHGASLARALLAMVENISQDRLPVLLVDDLHWADEGSRDWLDQVVKQTALRGILIVATVCEAESYGAPGIGPAGAAEYNLRPGSLSSASAGDLVLDRLGVPGDERFTAACHDATRGNPLHLVSLLQECRQRGLPPTAATAAQVAGLVPPGLRRRLLLCLREQPPYVMAVARALMVLRDDAEPQVVGELAALDPVDRENGLCRLRRLALVTGDDDCRLANQAVREAVEEATPPGERNRLHLRAAALLRYRGAAPERVAGHLLATTAQLDDDATAALRHAADAAMLRGAPEAAARHLRRALRDRQPHSEERARLLVELATVERSFAPSVAVRHVTQAFPLLPGPLARAEALMALTPVGPGATLLSLGDLLRQTTRELGAPQPQTVEQRPLALQLEARLSYLCDNDPTALAAAADRLARPDGRPDPAHPGERELLVALLHAVTVSAGLPATQVAALVRRVMDHEPASATHVHTLVPLVVPISVAADSVAGLDTWLATALADARRRGARLEESVILSEQALVLLAQGRLTAARDRVLLAHTMVEPEESTRMTAIALSILALRTREPALVATLPERFRGIDESCELAGLHALLRGLAAETHSELPLAVDHFMDAGYAMERAGWTNPLVAPARLWAARALHRMGERDRAEQQCGLHLEQARKWGAPSGLGRALTLQAELTGGTAALGLLREAAGVLEGSGDLHMRATVLLRLGRELAPRQGAEAEAALRTAYDLAVACGADHVAARAQELLGPTAVGVPRRTPLTSTELMVARMAARGLTNQAIADALSVSRRAVEKHLTSCYRKVSTSGRAGLADALEDAGLLAEPAPAPTGPATGAIRPQGAA
ncbi:transcriptional regulator, LuxR family [Actinobacteria bacterium OK074]|nr:transcriptional regulator, LuxR family [Actinobacteria bacterium OK074]